MKRLLCALCFVLMICCAGSDGPLFPYVNYIGTFIFGLLFVKMGMDLLPDEVNIKIT